MGGLCWPFTDWVTSGSTRELSESSLIYSPGVRMLPGQALGRGGFCQALERHPLRCDDAAAESQPPLDLWVP